MIAIVVIFWHWLELPRFVPKIAAIRQAIPAHFETNRDNSISV